MLEKLLLITGVVGAVLALLNVVGASTYEVQQLKQRQQQARHPNARRYRRRPLISVVVFAYNDAQFIERCLQSLAHGPYRKLEVIVVDNNSTDTTRQLVKRFMAEHPKQSIHLCAKRRPASRLEGLSYVQKKYLSGELIMLLDAAQVIDRHALSRAAAHFNSQPKLGILSLNSKVVANYSTVGLFQRFEELLRCRSKQFNSTFNVEYITQTNSTIYTRLALQQLLRPTKNQPKSRAQLGLPALRLGNKDMYYRFASDAVVYHEPYGSSRGLVQQRYQLQLARMLALWRYRRLFFRRDRRYTTFLTWFRLPCALITGMTALLVPVLATYFLYLALSLRQPALLLAACGAVSILMVSAIWGDEQLRLRQKLAYCSLVPVTYGVFYVLSFVQPLVILRGVSIAGRHR